MTIGKSIFLSLAVLVCCFDTASSVEVSHNEKGPSYTIDSTDWQEAAAMGERVVPPANGFALTRWGRGNANMTGKGNIVRRPLPEGSWPSQLTRPFWYFRNYKDIAGCIIEGVPIDHIPPHLSGFLKVSFVKLAAVSDLAEWRGYWTLGYDESEVENKTLTYGVRYMENGVPRIVQEELGPFQPFLWQKWPTIALDPIDIRGPISDLQAFVCGLPKDQTLILERVVLDFENDRHLRIPKGFFNVGDEHIFYSNGDSAYCYVPHPKWVTEEVLMIPERIFQSTRFARHGTCSWMHD